MASLSHHATHPFDTDILSSRRNLPTRWLPKRPSKRPAKMLNHPRSDRTLQPHTLTQHPKRNRTHPHHSTILTGAHTALSYLRRAPRRHLQVLPELPYLPQCARRLQGEESRKVRWNLRAPGAGAEARCRRDGEQRGAEGTSR